MSYDFELYTGRAVTLEPPQVSAGGIVTVYGPFRVEDEDEDIRENLLPVLGKKRVLHNIHLEGDLTPEDERVVDTWLKATVAQTKGVMVDLQTDRYETRTKSGQLDPQPEDHSECGWMSFKFLDVERFYETGLEEMLHEIAAIMAEALPTRYGHWEPLQGRVENGDVSDLIAAFKSEGDLCLSAKTPFGHIGLGIPCKKQFESFHPQHTLRRDFLVGSMNFEIRPQLFSQPEKFALLQTLFERLCVVLDVFYADIVPVDAWSSWLWNGLPDRSAHTICVGPA